MVSEIINDTKWVLAAIRARALRAPVLLGSLTSKSLCRSSLQRKSKFGKKFAEVFQRLL